MKAQEFSGYELDVFALDNGLTVILNPDNSQQKVFGGVVIRAGSKHDPADQTGIAHYLEHMLFKGTDILGTTNYEEEKPYLDKITALYDKLSKTQNEEERKKILKEINKFSVKAGRFAIPAELDKLVRSIGGTNLNAATGHEMTFYFNAFPPHQIEKWLDLYSHRFTNPVFRLFQSELEVVFEEKNMYNDNFITGVFETFMAHLFKKHPYGQQSIIGSTEHLKNPSLSKMYEFYNTYYVPNNMALILTGNFDYEFVKSHLQNYFGNLEYRPLPRYPRYEEEPFDGRELVSERLSPIKLGLMGFRTVPNTHEYEYAVDVFERILSNTSGTGVLDKLVLDNKLMYAGTLPIARFNDHGAGVILFIPKPFRQSLRKSENIVIDALKEIHSGNIDERLFMAVKNEIYLDYVSSMEDLQGRAVFLAQAFSQNRDIRRALDYPRHIQAVTIQDVSRVAQKYFNENYLVLHSKRGFPRKEKLEKPGFDPIEPDVDAVSPYAEVFLEQPAMEPSFVPVSFRNDVVEIQVSDHIKMFHVQNPVNDVFSVRFRVGIGHFEKPILKHAAQIMNYAGTVNRNVDELKRDFQNIGATYQIYSDNQYLNIEMRGLEQNFKDALLLLNELLNEPVIERDKVRLIYQEERTMRRLEDKDPASIARALVHYVRRGDLSTFINRPTLRQVRRFKTDELLEAFNYALQYQVEMHYVGSLMRTDELASLIETHLILSGDLQESKAPLHIKDRVFEKNKVFFVNDRNAIQSQIYFLVNGETFKPENDPYYEAFNEYFGGGFSGLVVQEIREFRSLAYATGASLVKPVKAHEPSFFTGYIGTQADKTVEAIETFMELFNNLPEKEERVEVLRQSLLEKLYLSRPHFRVLSKKVADWRHQGFYDDPALLKMEIFSTLNMNDIVTFHQQNLLNKPVVICIVGDKRKLDMQEIEKFGKIIEVRKRNLFSR